LTVYDSDGGFPTNPRLMTVGREVLQGHFFGPVSWRVRTESAH